MKEVSVIAAEKVAYLKVMQAGWDEAGQKIDTGDLLNGIREQSDIDRQLRP